MKKIAMELLRIIHDYGYEAFVVGGYVRDMLLGKESNDIDVTTNATPMELKNIFPDIKIPKINYGSVSLIYKNIRFEITTYRREDNYYDNRHPYKIEYVNDLKTDLLRRDFTINALCMDMHGNIIDLLNGKSDLNNHLIRTIGDSKKSFTDDALRILRAIRFATVLDFKLSDEIIEAISETKFLLKKLSYERKKYELDHIFASNRALEGINLLKKLDLLDDLDINNISRVKDYGDIIGIWAMINPQNYSFTSSERELINKVNIVYNLDNLDRHILYKYGLYVNLLAALNKGISKKKINEVYQNLPIKNRSDINLSIPLMCQKLGREPNNFVNLILDDLENKILDGVLINQEDILLEYVIENY